MGASLPPMILLSSSEVSIGLDAYEVRVKAHCSATATSRPDTPFMFVGLHFGNYYKADMQGTAYIYPS